MNMKNVFTLKKLLLVFIIILFLAPIFSDKAKILLIRIMPTTESPQRHFDLPEKTNWRPVGEKSISTSKNPNARQVTFARSMHTDTQSADEISTVVSPVLEFDWIAEPNFFVPEGPVFDSQGNIYFCPVLPPEEVIMVSIEPETGKRRWTLDGFSWGCGAPYILIDPDTGEDIVVVGTYSRAVAMTTEGEVLWDVKTGLEEERRDIIQGNRHNFGMNYSTKYDALISVLGDGSIYILDRKTGKSLLEKPFVMPGAKTPVNNFSLPASIAKKANEDSAHMFGGEALKGKKDFISEILHITAGEMQKVTNFFSIENDTGRIWAAATLPDEADGKVDGWAESAALYGMDVKEKGDYLTIEVASVIEVPGGTASTPALSRDGKRVYVADAFDSVYAIDTESGTKIWSVNVGAKVTGSLDVAADNNEIYANSRTEILKIIDQGDHAEIAWVAELDMFEPGLFQRNFKALGAEIAANGIAFTGAVGVNMGKKKFPFKLGAGVLDRETGELRYFTEGGEDSVSSTAISPDGGVYIGNSPLRRALGRAILGNDKSPMPIQGGITRYKAVHLELLIRDALWAASTRAENAASLTNDAVINDNVFQIQQLLDQVLRTLPAAVKEGNISSASAEKLAKNVQEIKTSLEKDSDISSLKKSAEQLSKLTDALE